MMDKNTKTANQAWRKRPRKFAPKSRLGCKTCKIRRVKCDLSRPSCLKCQSTGRTCDGYGELPLDGTTDQAEAGNSNLMLASAGAHQSRRWHVANYDLVRQGLGPLMILQATGPDEALAMDFFECVSINQLNEYQPCESWRTTLIFFSRTVPSVRHAATALALIHRNYRNRDYAGRRYSTESSKERLDWPPDKTPWLHFNRAIQLLPKQDNDDGIEATAITLLVCYLFFCFDHLAGGDVQATRHLRGGVEILRNIDQAKLLSNTSTFTDDNRFGARALISQVTNQIRRLEMQAATFLVDWVPVGMQEPPGSSQLLPSGDAFPSLDHAAGCLQILVARIMGLQFSGQQQTSPGGEIPPSAQSLRNNILAQLQTWSNRFENMLREANSYRTDAESSCALETLLRLQHTIAWTLLSSYGPGQEMEFDKFLHQFQQCVALAGDVHARYYFGSAQPTFTPEIGILPALYIIGVKCRHPQVRREVLGILRRQPIREAAWDSFAVARVVERVVEIEEGGRLEDGAGLLSMDQIPVWLRIEAMSWTHVVSRHSVSRMDIQYSFCTQVGTHTESLVV